MRYLYLHGTHVPPPGDFEHDRFAWLSPTLEGDVLQEVWWQSPKVVEKRFGPNSYPIYEANGVRYHFLLAPESGNRRSKVELAWFFLSEGMKVHRKRGFDCIIVYSHTLTALCGAILKLLTGAKLIVEIVGTPSNIYMSKSANPGVRARAAQFYSDVCLQIALRLCDRAHVYARSLLAAYRRLPKTPVSVFSTAVAVAQVPRCAESAEPYILLVGAPWYLKGADLLIQAFRGLSAEFPEFKLKLVGHYPDLERLAALAGGSPRIEILKPVSNAEALELIGRAAVFALPSRSEGTPRVVLEAMAAGVPVVGSDVGGIPFLIRHGENGFLIPAGDAAALETHLRRLLSDPELRRRMGDRGYELAHTEFSEKAYAEHFIRMVEDTVKA